MGKHNHLLIILLLVFIIVISINFIDNKKSNKETSIESELQLIVGKINDFCKQDKSSSKNIGKCNSNTINEEAKKIINNNNLSLEKIIYNGEKVSNMVIKDNNHKYYLCSNGKFNLDHECDEYIPKNLKFIDVVLNKFPYLELDTNGCKITNENNYSFMGGCYLKGNLTNNYVWYSGFLWRIMGINKDGTIRMITEDNVTTLSWGERNSTNDWDESYAKKWLNNYFYPKVKGNDAIVTEEFCSELIIDDIKQSKRTICGNNLSKKLSKVGMLTLDEYNLAGGKNSYLNIGLFQWTMTPYEKSKLILIDCYGGHDGDLNPDLAIGIRPIINIDSNQIVTSGNGIVLNQNWTKETGPYVLIENKLNNISKTKLHEHAVSGEYVQLANKKYRVVENKNNTVKLILDDFYIKDEKFGENSTFSINNGIGKLLNNDVYNWLLPNQEDKNKVVVNSNWYQTLFDWKSYETSLNEINTGIKSNVGLIRVGEMLSNQSSSFLTKGYKINSKKEYKNGRNYFLLNKHAKFGSWRISKEGLAYNYDVTLNCSIRPVIFIKEEVIINSGNGTWYNPYRI